MFRYYNKINKIGEEESRKLNIQFERSKIKKSKRCCGKGIEYDAEDFYKEQIVQTADIIKNERQQKLRGNGGLGFVTFSSNLQVKRCILTSHFKGMIMENLSPEERINSKVLYWNVTGAPSQSDIIWQNIYKEKNFWLILIVNFVFFLTFCILINPQTIVLYLFKKIGIEEDVK